MSMASYQSIPPQPRENIPWREIIGRTDKPGQSAWWVFLVLALLFAVVLLVLASAGPGMRTG
jgi:hypothetical protein